MKQLEWEKQRPNNYKMLSINEETKTTTATNNTAEFPAPDQRQAHIDYFR